MSHTQQHTDRTTRSAPGWDRTYNALVFGKDYPKTLTTKEEKYQHETELTLI